MIDFIVRLILGRSRYDEYLRQATDTSKKAAQARQHALKIRVDATFTRGR